MLWVLGLGAQMVAGASIEQKGGLRESYCSVFVGLLCVCVCVFECCCCRERWHGPIRPVFLYQRVVCE